jgi:hypothetical protein|tara:strand:- start:8699 stop:8848 length:150 start_codon:yes stop_codon:yes gene_type:complete
MEFIQNNWEWFLLGFMVVEKAIKLSPSKHDDMLLDILIKPMIEKLKPKK